MNRLSLLACALVLTACGRAPEDGYLGYIEGDFLRLGPREAGLVTALNVREGDTVAAGAALYSIDAERAQLTAEEAAARLRAAQARAADLGEGGRPQEIAAAQAELAQAQADLELARIEAARTEALVARDAAPRMQADEDRRALAAAEARAAELRSRLDLIRQPARDEQIAAARQEAEAAQAALGLAQQGLGDRIVTAPRAGRVDAIYLREGEFAAAGQPVLSLLPPDNLKAVFFVGEEALSGVSAGDAVTIACDGCGGGLTGSVTHVGARAEFAPPVIYSDRARATLVYRVEARPAEGAPWALNPGQPVQVTFTQASGERPQ